MKNRERIPYMRIEVTCIAFTEWVNRYYNQASTYKYYNLSESYPINYSKTKTLDELYQIWLDAEHEEI